MAIRVSREHTKMSIRDNIRQIIREATLCGDTHGEQLADRAMAFVQSQLSSMEARAVAAEEKVSELLSTWDQLKSTVGIAGACTLWNEDEAKRAIAALESRAVVAEQLAEQLRTDGAFLIAGAGVRAKFVEDQIAKLSAENAEMRKLLERFSSLGDNAGPRADSPSADMCREARRILGE